MPANFFFSIIRKANIFPYFSIFLNLNKNCSYEVHISLHLSSPYGDDLFDGLYCPAENH